jgi:hypothetical protein
VGSKLELVNAGVIDEGWASSSGLTTGAAGFVSWRGVGGMYGIVNNYRLDHQLCLRSLITELLTGDKHCCTRRAKTKCTVVVFRQ